MDLVTHAVVGGFTGAVFGRPLSGAVIAVVPDIVLGVKRVAKPNLAYTFTHCYLFVMVTAGLCGALFGGREFLCTAFVLLSHIVLDIPTHGKDWAPQIWFPFGTRCAGGTEWEWFNDSWFRGLEVAALWIAVCLPFIVLQW